MSAMKPMACYCGTCPTCTTFGAAPRPAVADPLEYRHGALKRRLLGSIASVEVQEARPLERFTTREDDDPAIALVDAFAGALHVLAWNIARLFDDGSIRRTRDRDALVGLTRLLGYEPRPALAATTTLAYLADEPLPGAEKPLSPPAPPKVPKGSKVASIPGPGEQPQVFETDAELEVRPQWNKLLPVLQKQAQAVEKKPELVVVEGTSIAVKAGDVVMLYANGATAATWIYARVSAVARVTDLTLPDTASARTELTLVYDKDIDAEATLAGATFWNRIVVLGERAAAFGANSPDAAVLTKEVVLASGTLEIKPVNTNAAEGVLDLDALHADAVPGDLVLFEASDDAPSPKVDPKLGRIKQVREVARAGWGLSAKVTRMTVAGVDLTGTGYKNKVRETAIYIETARGKLVQHDVDEPLPKAAEADRILVQGHVELPPGRRVVLSGELWKGEGKEGPPAGEVAIVKSCTPTNGTTLLVFTRALATTFRSTRLAIFGNSVGASHGDTPPGDPELLGSGSGTAASPRFRLKRSPLTYVPSADTLGYKPAIEVRVGNRLYGAATTLFGRDSADRLYTVKPMRDGGTEVQFAGRLPSGTNNVSAIYRTGGGLGGNLASGRIATAMSPVPGVAKVVNPVPAEGGSDSESIEDLRTQAPQSIRTLDRVVSLADYEAFARSRRGVGKALATELQVGMRSVVCITIATTALESPVPGSDIVESLRDALVGVSAPGRSVRIQGFDKLNATVVAALAIDPAFQRGEVEARARQVLARRFGPAERRFGEALQRNVVLAALQSVEGVVAARIDKFERAGGPPESEGRLFSPMPRVEAGQYLKAGLLCIDADAVQFVEMKP